MDDLITFFKARLGEDEAMAKEAAATAPPPWKAAEDEWDTWIVVDATGEPLIYDEGTPSLTEAAHIARHDPARVLREVAAKRAILDRWRRAFDEIAFHRESGDPAESLTWARMSSELHIAVRHLAAVWSDHADYRQEWALGD